MIDTNQQEALTADLVLLLKELETPNLSPGDLKAKANRLKDIYLSEQGELYRHSYSQITSYMYCSHILDDGVPTPDPGTIIIENLNSIANDWEQNLRDSEQKKELCGTIRKLIDHINLEVVRLSQMADIYYKLAKTDSLNTQLDQFSLEIQQVSESINKQKEAADEVGRQIDDRKEEVLEIQREVKNHNTQSITVLSIFSCVVFAFTGGFSLVSGSLSALSGVTKQNSFLLFSILIVLCTALTDSIYMLLRAARHYSSTRQGHLEGFIICNICSAVISAGLFVLFIWNPFHLEL